MNYTHGIASADLQAVWALPGLISAEVARVVGRGILTEAIRETSVNVGGRLPKSNEGGDVEDATHGGDIQSGDAREMSIFRR